MASDLNFICVKNINILTKSINSDKMNQTKFEKLKRF